MVFFYTFSVSERKCVAYSFLFLINLFMFVNSSINSINTSSLSIILLSLIFLLTMAYYQSAIVSWEVFIMSFVLAGGGGGGGDWGD